MPNPQAITDTLWNVYWYDQPETAETSITETVQKTKTLTLYIAQTKLNKYHHQNCIYHNWKWRHNSLHWKHTILQTISNTWSHHGHKLHDITSKYKNRTNTKNWYEYTPLHCWRRHRRRNWSNSSGPQHNLWTSQTLEKVQAKPWSNAHQSQTNLCN